MKVCFVSPYSPKLVTGIGTFLLELCKGLETKGHQSIIITVFQDNALDFEGPSKIDLVEVDCRKLPRLKDLYFTFKTILELLKRRKNIDVIHTQQPHLSNLLSTILGKTIGIPVVTTFHAKVPRPDNFIKKKALNFYENTMPHFSDALVFGAEMTKRKFGIQKGTVIYNGIDMKKYAPNDEVRDRIRSNLKLSNQFIILFSARWAENKGMLELLAAFSRVLQLTGGNLKLILTGGGDTYITNRVFDKMQELQLEQYVLPVGRVDNVLNYFQIADLFVLPSHHEGLPMAMQEAMACGLPVIVSKVGGNIEVIDEWVNGLFIEPKDIDDLTEKIVWCIKHNKERQEIGKKARESVVDKFSLELMISNYLELYHNLTANAPHSVPI